MKDLEALMHSYVERFNREDTETDPHKVPNRDAANWMAANIPLFSCPDKEIERTYYFRWWTLRKHFRETPAGTLITEFLPDVPWSGPFNTINCASGFHIREARWLRNSRADVESYIRFWADQGPERRYSSWFPRALWEYACVAGREDLGAELLEALMREYAWYEQTHFDTEKGLFWSIDNLDGMELSVSGPGLRPTINSYMAANALAIASFAERAGRLDTAAEYRQKAEALRAAMEKHLWRGGMYKTADSTDAVFVKTATQDFGSGMAHDTEARELVGFVPWIYALPPEGHDGGFRLLTDPSVFLGKKGLRTCDAGNPLYNYEFDHECLWNGPSWPFATGQTLAACAELLQRYETCAFTKEDYLALLHQYAAAHVLEEDGKTVCWIDENMDPETGRWLARDIMIAWDRPTIPERGKDYNHSLFCDLVITGLFGVRPDEDGKVTFRPLLPECWDEAVLDGLVIGGHSYRIEVNRGKMTVIRDGLPYSPEE